MEELILIESGQYQITQIDFFIRLIVTVGIGFVIGLEREHASLSKKEEIFAGLRTFVMVGLLGFVTGILSVIFSFWMTGIVFLGLSIMVTVSYWMSASRGQFGGTTEITTLLVYLLGCLTLLGHIELSLALTVIITLFLSLKVKFQSIVGRITQHELFAFIQFVIIVLLIFPFLPDENFGPFNVINPKEIGWVIILTSGVGFIGYMLMKFLGSNRGILLTGIVGGLVSSTVVTWVFSKKSHINTDISNSSAVAIMAASTIMIIRVFLWVSIFNRTLLAGIFLPLSLILLVAFITTFYFYNRKKSTIHDMEDIPLGDPLDLRGALFFGIIYSAILLIVSYANDQFGSSGMYISSLLAGLTDIDAISISISKIAGSTLELLTAQNAIILATLSNTIVKLGITLWAGSLTLRKDITLGYGLIIVAGLVGMIIINI